MKLYKYLAPDLFDLVFHLRATQRIIRLISHLTVHSSLSLQQIVLNLSIPERLVAGVSVGLVLREHLLSEVDGMGQEDKPIVRFHTLLHTVELLLHGLEGVLHGTVMFVDVKALVASVTRDVFLFGLCIGGKAPGID